MAIRAFISYSHKDTDLLTQFHEHLSALQRQELLDAWTDREIQAGGVIDAYVEEQIEQAELYLFLISSAFIQSDYCFEKEFARACERQQAGEAIVVPIIIRECDWKIPELRRFKALPEDGKPVVSRHWHSPDEAFANVAAGLRTLIEHGSFSKAKRRTADKASSAPPENPKAFALTTKKEMPQWADSRELNLRGRRLEVVKCKIETESPYFRFGFKLLNENARLFGDGSIKSQEANLVVHVGRNNWNRPHLGISAKDIFFTCDVNGVPLQSDKKVFSAGRRFSVPIELRIDSAYNATFTVNGIRCINRIVPPGICRRVIVLAWSDGEEYEVQVTDLLVSTA